MKLHGPRVPVFVPSDEPVEDDIPEMYVYYENLKQLRKHLPGQHEQKSHGRKGKGQRLGQMELPGVNVPALTADEARMRSSLARRYRNRIRNVPQPWDDVPDNYMQFVTDFDEVGLIASARERFAFFGVSRDVRRKAAELLGFPVENTLDPHLQHELFPDWGGGAMSYGEPHNFVDAVTLLRAVRQGSMQPILWRGVNIHGPEQQKMFDAVKRGQVIDLPLASFADMREDADRFGTDVTIKVRAGALGDLSDQGAMSIRYTEADRERAREFGKKPGDPVDEGEDPDTYYDIMENVYEQGQGKGFEIISGGRFKVVSVNKSNRGTTITLEQIGVFDVDDDGRLVPRKDIIESRIAEVSKADEYVGIPDWGYVFDIPFKQASKRKQLRKHLPGQHEQKTHGRGGGGMDAVLGDIPVAERPEPKPLTAKDRKRAENYLIDPIFFSFVEWGDDELPNMKKSEAMKLAIGLLKDNGFSPVTSMDDVVADDPKSILVLSHRKYFDNQVTESARAFVTALYSEGKPVKASAIVFSPTRTNKQVLIHELAHIVSEDNEWSLTLPKGTANPHRVKWLRVYADLLDKHGMPNEAKKMRNFADVATREALDE